MQFEKFFELFFFLLDNDVKKHSQVSFFCFQQLFSMLIYVQQILCDKKFFFEVSSAVTSYHCHNRLSHFWPILWKVSFPFSFQLQEFQLYYKVYSQVSFCKHRAIYFSSKNHFFDHRPAVRPVICSLALLLKIRFRNINRRCYFRVFCHCVC